MRLITKFSEGLKVELLAWLSLAAVCIFGAMTPGPSFIVVLKHTISSGRVNGLLSSLGQAIGVACYATLTILGLAVVIAKSPVLFEGIRYASIAFILYLAYQALTSKSAFAQLDSQKLSVTRWQSFREGFMIAFVNPKLAVFFLALFSQFIEAQATGLQNLVMVSTVAGADLIWYSSIVMLMSTPSLMAKLREHMKVVEKITGLALLTVAARVAF